MSEHHCDRVTCDECRSPVSGVRVVIGPPRQPGDVGLWPPIAMRESRAWCEHVDQVRAAYSAKLRRCP